MTLFKSLAIAAVVSLIAFFAIPDTLGAQWGVVIGLLLGSIIGSVASTMGGTQQGSTTNSSDSASNTTLYVGNLAFRASRQELQQLFEKYGTVNSVRIMTDRATRKPRGFGFVEMDNKGAKAASKALNGFEFAGRSLRINEANERKEREAA